MHVSTQQAEVTKFLGVLLDQHLSWKCHISHVAKNVLCTHLVINSFLILLTSPLLLIAKYTHIILKMIITPYHISVEQTLNSSQSSI